MNHFEYIDGILHAEDVAIPELAAAVGTPFYCYSTATLERHYRVFEQALPKGTLVAFAVKANGSLAVIKTLGRLGAGADIVSGGEMQRALAAGIPANKIVFSGVGKSRAEIAAAIDAGIKQFNVESEEELEVISSIATSKQRVARISLRINPDVDAQTHAKISTGKAENKFGISWRRAQQAFVKGNALPGLNLCGVDVHIGSQVTTLEPFRKAFGRVAELVRELRASGCSITSVDLGGGLGVPYSDADAPPLPDAYGAIVRDIFHKLDVELIVEPGRLICANAGVLVSTVLYVKKGDERNFIILDAGMNDLVRPAMYDAKHDIVPIVGRTKELKTKVYDVVGPVCESSDVFAKNLDLPPASPGDLVAILSAGAYGAVQASSYNARPLIPEVLVNGRHFAVTRPRYSVEEMIAKERMPVWLS